MLHDALFLSRSNRGGFSQKRRATIMLQCAALFGCALTLAAPGAQLLAQTAATHFVPFGQFLQETKGARSEEFLARPEIQTKNSADFEAMRQSILARYEGVTVTHSFVVDGQHYDCVPTNQQPAVRTYGLKSIADAPPLDLLKSGAPALSKGAKPATQTDPAKPFDAFGNLQRCEANTVPLERITLDTLTRFATLQDFYRKGSSGAIAAAGKESFVDPTVAAHKYSITYQNVNNLGGNSNLNVWSPYVNTGAGEVFSLSQEWYVGGGGSATQTEEVGWVVYPQMFGNEKAHFFIFSTADDYATGCWNNSCGDFVQVADSGLLGASFSKYSTYGGAQYEFAARYYLYNGNWWLAYQGTWVGYYPGAKYHGGQNTRYAQQIQFGTESVGTTIWPGEGSGNWSSTGFGEAAYQRNLFYQATSGTLYWDSLTRYIPSPACYTTTGPYYSTSSGWGIYFYEGGPGGTRC
jgi:hypothetical protein